MVDNALRSDRSADALVDHPHHFEHTVATMCADRDAIAHAHRRGGLRRMTVDTDMTTAARVGRR